MKEKLVSVILPAYNSSKYIEYTIASLQNQTYKNIEKPRYLFITRRIYCTGRPR